MIVFIINQGILTGLEKKNLVYTRPKVTSIVSIKFVISKETYI